MLVVDEHSVVRIEADRTPPSKIEAVFVFESLFEHTLFVMNALLLLS